MEVYDGSCAQCDEQMKDWVTFIWEKEKQSHK